MKIMLHLFDEDIADRYFCVLNVMAGKQPFNKVAKSGNHISNHAKCLTGIFKMCYVIIDCTIY